MRPNTYLCITLCLCFVIFATPGMTQHTAEKSKSPQPTFQTVQLPALFPKPNRVGAFMVNDVQTIKPDALDTPLAIAMRYNIPLRNILRYNDLRYNHFILPGQNVFLQPKRQNWRGRASEHIVQAGETLYSIAQLYGIRLKALYRKNKLQDDREPLVGETIVIRGKRYLPPAHEQRLNTPQIAHNEIPEQQGPFQPKTKLQPAYPLIEMEIAPEFDQATRAIPSSMRSITLPVFRGETKDSNATLPIPNNRHKNNRYGADSQQADAGTIWARKN